MSLLPSALSPHMAHKGTRKQEGRRLGDLAGLAPSNAAEPVLQHASPPHSCVPAVGSPPHDPLGAFRNSCVEAFYFD